MKKLLFLILIVVLSGCGVSKKAAVKEDIKQDIVENVDKSEKETAIQDSHADITKESKTNTIDKSITRKTETEYSAPDSTGQQYRTKETTTETLSDVSVINEQNERIIIEQKQEIEQLTADNSQLRTQLESSLQEKNKTTTRVPVWTYIVAFLIGAGVALIIRKWLKKKFKF